MRAMCSPTGQHVMLPTPAQPTKHDGIGAVDDQRGETVVRFKPHTRHTRRQAIAERWEALLDTHPTGAISGAWDTAGTRERLRMTRSSWW